MKYRCRCRNYKCQSRRTLNKHPDNYKIKRKCHCGALYRVDICRQTRSPSDNPPACNCNGAWRIIHRLGQVGCLYNKDNAHNMIEIPALNVIPDDWYDEVQF